MSTERLRPAISPPSSPHRLRRLVVALAAASLVSAGLLGSSWSNADTETSPYGIWSSAATPVQNASSDKQAVELGVQFDSKASGTVSAIQFYKFAGNDGPHTGRLWTADGKQLASVNFAAETGSGWQTAQFVKPVAIDAGAVYVASYSAPHGGYADDENTFSGGSRVATRDLTALEGVYSYNSSFPTEQWHGSNYFVDIVFSPAASDPGQSSPPPPTSSPTPTSTPSSTPSVPSPTATTSTTPPPPSGGKNCAPVPSACGFPDATNTGVKPGTVLRKSGSVTLRDNAVLENAEVDGTVEVEGSNVTIRNVRILENGDGWGIGLRHTKNTLITDVEIYGGQPRLEVGIKDVYGDASNTQILRTEITRTSSGIQTHEGLIQDNYIHDMGYQSGDHINGTTSNGSTVPLTIRHNTVFNQLDQTDAVSLFEDFGTEANRVIDDNLLAGGGYTIYGGQNAGGPLSTNVKIRNNRISRIFFPNGGGYGPIAAFDAGAPGNEWSGNVWDEDGSAIHAP
jgi:hypothetical protein